MNKEQFVAWLESKGFKQGIDTRCFSMRVWTDYIIEIFVYDTDWGIYLENEHDPEAQYNIDYSNFQFPASPEAAESFFKILGVIKNPA